MKGYLRSHNVIQICHKYVHYSSVIRLLNMNKLLLHIMVGGPRVIQRDSRAETMFYVFNNLDVREKKNV